MATKKSQRIGIWIITVVLVVGTIGAFAAMMIAPGLEAGDKAKFDKENEAYSNQMQAYQTKVDEEGAKLSDVYFEEFSAYTDRVGKFNPDEIKDLETKDLKEGDGEKITYDTSFSAYYIGWNPDGEIFDQSIEGDKLKTPFSLGKLGEASVIEGWREGLDGMKIGGVRELALPPDYAYGEQGGGELIKPNTPLKFIVMAIEDPGNIKEPEMSDYLKKEYERRYGVKP